MVVRRAPSPIPGLLAEATPAAVAFASATFSAHGPPEKWNTLTPVKTRPSLHNAAEPTVLEEGRIIQHSGKEIKRKKIPHGWYVLLDNSVLGGAPRNRVDGRVSRLDEGFLGFR